MLLDSSDESRIKAVDFGLAVPYEDKDLPLGDLGFDGTPWYMAPEMLRSEVVPASDLFAAGVMAFQLLSGRFPFNDRRNPYSPALSLVWRSILTEQPDFTKPYWEDISDEAKDLVAKLLEKDPAKRPTAAEALSHPWLKGDISERHAAGPKPIESTIVQRIQRHSQASAFKRSVLELMAEELLTMHPASKNEAALQTALKTPTMSRKVSAGGGGGAGEVEDRGERRVCSSRRLEPCPEARSMPRPQPSMSVFSPGASVHGKASASPGASQHGQQMSLIAYMDLMSKQGDGSSLPPMSPSCIQQANSATTRLAQPFANPRLATRPPTRCH